MEHNIEVLSVFSIFALLILVAPSLSNLTRIPIVVIEMILGALAGHFVGFSSDISEINLIAEAGFLFLMFLCGLEVDIKSFNKLGKTFLGKALSYFLILYGVTCTIVFILDLSFIYIAAFPVMSLGLIMALIKDYGKAQIWLDLALKIGIIGELISIIVLVVLDGSMRHGLNNELWQRLAVLALFLIIIAFGFKVARIVFWWFPQIRFVVMPTNDSNSQDLRFVAFLLMVFVFLMMALEIKAVLGAFLAGTILSTFFRHKAELPKKLNDFGFGFLVPFFFVHIGSTLDLNVVFSHKEILLNAFYLIAGMCFLRLVGAYIVFSKYFKNIKSTLLFALSSSMPLTFLVATATLGHRIGEINDIQYTSFVLGAIMQGVVFNIIIKIIYHCWQTKKTQTQQ